MNKFDFVKVEQSEQQESMASYTPGALVALKKFGKNKLAIFGTFTLILLILCSIIFMFLPNYNEDYINQDLLNSWPPSSEHWLGTDQFGRDLWSRNWGAIRYSLILALTTTTLNILIAIVIGVLMGYFVMFDKGFGFVIKVLYALPSIIILILFSVIFKTNDPFLSFLVIVVSLVFSGWVNPSQQIRGVALKIKNLDFVTASQTLGTRKFKILKIFLSYSMPVIIIQFAITFPRMIISESILGFLGLSIPNEPTLGNLINDGRTQFLTYPYQLFIPLASLAITTVSIQFIGMGVEDALGQEGS